MTAQPFPHLVIDDFLHIDRGFADSFASDNWPQWMVYSDAHQPGNCACGAITVIPYPWLDQIIELNSPRFLQLLEAVTDISKLIPDPYLEGGGLHLSSAGGILQLHTDFHSNQRLDLYRRVNVLVYLNSDWKEGDGGSLQFSAHPDGTGECVTIDPIWGRCVIVSNELAVGARFHRSRCSGHLTEVDRALLFHLLRSVRVQRRYGNVLERPGTTSPLWSGT